MTRTNSQRPSVRTSAFTAMGGLALFVGGLLAAIGVLARSIRALDQALQADPYSDHRALDAP